MSVCTLFKKAGRMVFGKEFHEILSPLFEGRHRWLLLSTLVACALTIISLFLLSYAGQQSLWTSAFGYTRPYTAQAYCEQFRAEQFSLQPALSLSNLMFICLGMMITSLGIADHVDRTQKAPITTLRPMTQTPIWSIVIGLSEIYIGAGSYMFHSSFRVVPHILDVAAIYCGLAALIIYNVFRLSSPLPQPVEGACKLPASLPKTAKWAQRTIFTACLLLWVLFGCGLSYTEKTKMKASLMLPALIAVIVLQLVLHACLYSLALVPSNDISEGQTLSKNSRRKNALILWCGRSRFGRPSESYRMHILALIAMALAYWSRTMVKHETSREKT